MELKQKLKTKGNGINAREKDLRWLAGRKKMGIAR